MTVEAIGEVPQWTLGDRMGKALRESDIGVQGMADYLGVARLRLGLPPRGKGC